LVAAVARSEWTQPVHFSAEARFQPIFDNDIAIDRSGIEWAVEIGPKTIETGYKECEEEAIVVYHQTLENLRSRGQR
jgi:hypothetical protein